MSAASLGGSAGCASAPSPTRPPSAPRAMPASRAAVRQRMCSSRAIATHKPGDADRAPACITSAPRYSHAPRMAAPQAEYELVLMLDPEAPDERREEIAGDARKRIESGGELKHDTSWGMRKMAYEIRQRTEADYRFFRFGSNGTPLLDDLNHNLRIADGVLRFRLFKVDPRTPGHRAPAADAALVRPSGAPAPRRRPPRWWLLARGRRRAGGSSHRAGRDRDGGARRRGRGTAGRGPRRHRGAAGRSARCPRGAGRSAPPSPPRSPRRPPRTPRPRPRPSPTSSSSPAHFVICVFSCQRGRELADPVLRLRSELTNPGKG